MRRSVKFTIIGLVIVAALGAVPFAAGTDCRENRGEIGSPARPRRYVLQDGSLRGRCRLRNRLSGSQLWPLAP